MRRPNLPHDAKMEGDRMMATVQSMLEARQYTFKWEKVTMPNIMRPFVTTEVRETLLSARDAAETAFEGLNRLDDHFRQCFYRLCPMNDLARFEDHCYSIQRLFTWRADYSESDNKTPAPTPKFPATKFKFYVDETAYKTYMEEHRKLRLQYLNGPYLRWRLKGNEIEDLLRSSGLSYVDQRQCREWWAGFLQEMRPWETRFDELNLPSWSEMLDILTAAIELAVDMKNEWELVH